MPNTNLSDKLPRSFLNPAILAYLVFGVICVALIIKQYRAELDRLQNEEIIALQTQLETSRKTVNNAVKWRLNDLYYLQRSFEKISGTLNVEAEKAILSDLWLSFSESREIYLQMRWLDTDGAEKLRVNQIDGQYLLVPEQSLQLKAGRDYFSEGMQLPVGSLFISRVDLNIDNDEVTLPYQPTVRVGIRIADRLGADQGMILINYDATDIFRRVSGGPKPIWILDDQGYWLEADAKEKLWGHALDDESLNIAVQYPEAAARIQQEHDGVFQTADGLWVFDTAFETVGNTIMEHSALGHVLLLNQRGYPWKLVGYVPQAELNQLVLPVHQFYRVVLIGTFVILILLGVFFKRYMTEHEKRMVAERSRHLLEAEVRRRTKELDTKNAQLAELARLDPLTNLYNRRYFDERFRDEFVRMQRTGHLFSLILLDLDHFKRVNDVYGHDVGDKVLRKTADALLATIRKTDFLARVGGGRVCCFSA